MFYSRSVVVITHTDSWPRLLLLPPAPPAPPPAEPAVQENGETNGEVKEPAAATDPAAPKKCDVIVISGRKERCEAAVEALKVRGHTPAPSQS